MKKILYLWENGNRASIGDGVRAKTLFITDTKHPLNYWGEAIIQIGCNTRSIVEWEEHFREIGRIRNYSEEEIEHYGKLIQLIKQYHLLVNPVKEVEG